MYSRFWLVSISLFISVVLMISSLCACSRDEGQQKAQLQAAQEKQTQEKESKKLKSIEEQIENLFKALGGPSLTDDEQSQDNMDTHQKDSPHDEKHEANQQEGAQQGDKQKENQQEGTAQSGKEKDSQQKDTPQGEKKTAQNDTQQAQQPQDKWSQVDRIISNLHYQWNDLMPEIAQKGADMKLVDNFDNALNSLTTTIESKDQDKVLISANKLYSYIPDLYSLYRVKMSPEVKRMIYYTRNIVLESDKDGWEQVSKDNESLERSWSLFRNTLEKEQKTMGDKLDFSIYELKKVISDKNKQLTGIKGMIVLNNIKKLQKSFEEKK